MKEYAKIILSFVLYKLTGIKTKTAKREIEASRIRREEKEREWNQKCAEIQKLLDEEHLRRFGWTAEKRQYAL